MSDLSALVWNDVVAGDFASAISRTRQHTPSDLLEDPQLHAFWSFIEGARAPRTEAVAAQRIGRLFAAYSTYWVNAVLGTDTHEALELELFQKLEHIVGVRCSADWDILEPALARFVERDAVNALFGRTLPLRECMLWSSDHVVEYEIDLPLELVNLPVRMLEGFYTKGWCHTITGGARGTGGWVEDGQLCCVADAWDTRHESFRVSYLAHEAQHHSDRIKFAWLEQPELEYRAKLTELALANETLDHLIERFSRSHRDVSGKGLLPQRTQSPHILSEYWLFEDLTSKLGEGWSRPFARDSEELKRACTELLLESSAPCWRGCLDGETDRA